MESSLYERMGRRLTRYLQNMCHSAPERKATTDFINFYVTLPLFLVGFSDDDPILGGDCEVSGFHLPFPHLLLEFPKLSRDAYAPLESIQYSQTYHPLVFVAEITPHLFAFDVLTLSEDSSLSFLYNIDKLDQLPGTEFLKDAPRAFIDDYLLRKAFNVDYSGLFEFDEHYRGFDVMPNLYQDVNCTDNPVPFPDSVPERIKNRTIEEITVSFPTLTGYFYSDQDCIHESELSPIKYWADLIILAVYYISSPTTYIVKETEDLTPREQRLKQKAIKPFFDKHPRHIVLKYDQVKEIVARDGEKEQANKSKRSPLPHERRGHWRMLTHDRFKEKKPVWVRPADVGKGLKIRVGHRTYEVIR